MMMAVIAGNVGGWPNKRNALGALSRGLSEIGASQFSRAPLQLNAQTPVATLGFFVGFQQS